MEEEKMKNIYLAIINQRTIFFFYLKCLIYIHARNALTLRYKIQIYVILRQQQNRLFSFFVTLLYFNATIST